jgi:hypothetical protein
LISIIVCFIVNGCAQAVAARFPVYGGRFRTAVMMVVTGILTNERIHRSHD